MAARVSDMKRAAMSDIMGTSWFGLIAKGGWPMYLLLFLLIWVVFVFIKRSITIYKACESDEMFMGRIKDYVLERRFDSAKKLCRASDLPIAKILEMCVCNLDKSSAEIAEIVENAGDVEGYRLEQGISILASISSVAPTIGLLGGVLKIMRVSLQVAQVDISQTLSLFSMGMWQALSVVAMGLMVGLIAKIAYTLLTPGVSKAIQQLEQSSLDFILTLNAAREQQQQITQKKATFNYGGEKEK